MVKPESATIITGLLAFVAWFLSLFSGVHCKFLTNTLTNNDQEMISLNFGIWYYQGFVLVSDTDGTVVYEKCRSYPDEIYVDAKWKSAMAFSTLTILLGGAVSIWVLFAACSSPSKNAFRVAGITFLLCCLFQGISLLFLTSSACTSNSLATELQEVFPTLQLEDTCTMSVSAKCTIAAIVFWFFAAIPALKIDVPPLGAVHTEKNAASEDNKEIGSDRKEKEDAVGEEEISEEHTFETTKAA